MCSGASAIRVAAAVGRAGERMGAIPAIDVRLSAPRPGGCAAPEAVDVMREHGLDISRHESQPLTEKLIRHADVISAEQRVRAETGRRLAANRRAHPRAWRTIRSPRARHAYHDAGGFEEGEIGQELVDSFDQEARRRVANATFYGAILFLSLTARKADE